MTHRIALVALLAGVATMAGVGFLKLYEAAGGRTTAFVAGLVVTVAASVVAVNTFD